MSVRTLLSTRGIRRGAALTAVSALVLTGCGSDESTQGGDTPSDVIEVTIKDDEISPLGERFEVKAGESFSVSITADQDGALHVHSNPEQVWDYSDGTTEHEVTIDEPGVVEVELHDPDVVVLQLEVS